MTRGSFIFICRFCNLAAASTVLGMSEKFVNITSFISLSVDVVESSPSTCNIEGAMPWQMSSVNEELLNLAAASIWLSQVMQLALLVPLKVLMFFIICFVPSSFLLLTTCVRMFVNASVMFAHCAGDILFIGSVCTAVLVLGKLVSW